MNCWNLWILGTLVCLQVIKNTAKETCFYDTITVDNGCRTPFFVSRAELLRRVNDFYKRRGLTKSLNEFKARFIAMRKLHRYSVFNTVYALAVLGLRLMPARVVKWAYKFDRILLEKIVKH